MSFTLKRSSLLLTTFFLLACALLACKLPRYRFNDASFPPDLKVIKINYIENKASYVNPQISPRLTDRLRQKITSQTRLKQTNGDDADWEVTAEVSEYSFSTSGIANQQATNSRITVGIRIQVLDKKKDETKDYTVSRSFDFSSQQTLQQAEAGLLEDMIKNLTDDVFNRIFSNW